MVQLQRHFITVSPTMDENFWRQVDRARRMTGEERFREGLALVDRSFRLMDDGVRHQFPNATPEERRQIRRERLARLRSVEAKR
ncbi:MAG: hypothetical protein AB7G28_06130 [Pirellulales bacterium]